MLKIQIEINIKYISTEAQNLFKTFYQCAYNNLINFLLKNQNFKN